MTMKELLVSIALALAWTGAALYAIRPPAYTPLRYYLAQSGGDEYRIQAHEVRQEGFCSVFIRDEVRIAAVCGQHTWSEAVEVE